MQDTVPNGIGLDERWTFGDTEFNVMFGLQGNDFVVQDIQMDDFVQWDAELYSSVFDAETGKFDQVSTPIGLHQCSEADL